MKGIGQEPAIEGLNPLEVSILMGKYSILLGLINYGTAKQRAFAKSVINELESYVYNHVNLFSFELANRNLSFSEQEIQFIENVIK
jgi:hypothetical protein